MMSFTEEKRDEIVKAWLRVQETTTQVAFCADLAERTGKVLSPRTLRSWLKGATIQPDDAAFAKALRTVLVSMRELGVTLEQVAEVVRLRGSRSGGTESLKGGDESGGRFQWEIDTD